jgi:hypothetical protein
VRNAPCPVLVAPSFPRVRKELVNKTVHRQGVVRKAKSARAVPALNKT